MGKERGVAGRQCGDGEDCGIVEEWSYRRSNVHLAEGGGLYGKKRLAPMDGWMVGRTDGRMDVWLDGWMDGG